jgi:hypothetical protein
MGPVVTIAWVRMKGSREQMCQAQPLSAVLTRGVWLIVFFRFHPPPLVHLPLASGDERTVIGNSSVDTFGRAYGSSSLLKPSILKIHLDSWERMQDNPARPALAPFDRPQRMPKLYIWCGPQGRFGGLL